MDILVYFQHYWLPFSLNPQNPNLILNLEQLEGWTGKKRISGQDSEERPITELWFMPFFMGLRLLDIPKAMAHVSMVFDLEARTVRSPERIWVQITTDGKWRDKANNIPTVVSDGKPTVDLLWKHDDNIFNPSQLLDGEDWQRFDPESWRVFFLKKLQAEKFFANRKAAADLAAARQVTEKTVANQKVAVALATATRIAERYSVIPS